MSEPNQRALVPIATELHTGLDTVSAVGHASPAGMVSEQSNETSTVLEVAAREELGDTIETVIERWLMAAAEKSGSTRTPATYRALLDDYRAWLTERGLDLNSDPRALAGALSSWAQRPRKRDGAPVSDATRALRIAAVGSFYAFAIEDVIIQHEAATPFRELHSLNPAKLKTIVARPKPKKKPVYGLDRAEVEAAISAIDATTSTGKRDLAFLALALTCGRRISELRDLQLRDIHDCGGWERGAIIVTWRRTKGHADGADNLLAPEAIAPLRDWLTELRRLAERAGVTLTEQATLWPRLDPATTELDVTRPLGYTGLQRLYDRRLGTTKTHRGRHSFAIAMLEDNANVVEIMNALGHTDLAVTTAYVRQLNEGLQKDTHASAVARSFGFSSAHITE